MVNSKIFISLSLTILLIDSWYIYINRQQIEKAFYHGLQSDNHNLYRAFQAQVDATYDTLQLLASIYASDAKVVELFAEGAKAQKREGGGAGGQKAALARQKLFDYLNPIWRKAQDKYHFRQLHFHLGPGDTSFLRVHSPGQFGDNMDDVRYTIVDTNKNKTPTFGFETGRVYSGLRGVVPVFENPRVADDSLKIFIGSLEVGTSFDRLLRHFDNNFQTGISVLLTKNHAKRNMWPDFFAERFGGGLDYCECLIESQSREGFQAILEAADLKNTIYREDGKDNLVQLNGKAYYMSFFKFNDYIGEKRKDHDHVGAIVIWDDVTDAFREFKEDQAFNIFYGVIAFILVELLMGTAFWFTHRRLVSANAILDRANIVKTEFLRSMSHELKTPLNSILGFATLLSLEKEIEPKQKQSIDEIIGAGNHLMALVNDVLDIEKIEQQKLLIEPKVIKVCDALEEASGIVKSLLDERNIELDFAKPKNEVYIEVDPLRFRQIVINLLSNAVKYSHENSSVRLYCESTGNYVKILFQDYGSGIPQDLASQVFEPYNRLNQSEGRVQGSGLGLGIAKKLTEHMNGKIGFSSEVGKGTLFWVEFPTVSPDINI